MEIIQKKIQGQDDVENYNGVIAYGKGKNGKTYVLKTFPDKGESQMFIIYQSIKNKYKSVFKKGDEMGDGLIFDYYDESIEGFSDFLGNN